MAVNKTAIRVKMETLGFVNWTVQSKDGKQKVVSKRGFPIFDNPEYPNDQEKWLIELAKANDGLVELNMQVRVFACDGSDAGSKLPAVKGFV